MKPTYLILKMVTVLLRAFPAPECKPIGNFNPVGLHCLSCTIADLQDRADAALKFWDDEDRWKRALS